MTLNNKLYVQNIFLSPYMTVVDLKPSRMREFEQGREALCYLLKTKVNRQTSGEKMVLDFSGKKERV